jgi:citrate synthase
MLALREASMVEIDGIRYLTVEEACALMGVKPATIYAYVSRGTLRSYKQGIKRQRLYREDEVKALMEIQPGGSQVRAAEEKPARIAPPRSRETVARSDGGRRGDAMSAGNGERGRDVLPPAEWWMGDV